MLPDFLLPEGVVREDGNGPAVELGPAQGKVILVTLGINRIIEQESLDVAIWGSADGKDWGAKPIQSFPQKFYCGVYSLLLDLTAHPETKYLRVSWKAARWGRGESTPLFGFYVFADLVKEGVVSAGA